MTLSHSCDNPATTINKGKLTLVSLSLSTANTFDGISSLLLKGPRTCNRKEVKKGLKVITVWVYQLHA